MSTTTTSLSQVRQYCELFKQATWSELKLFSAARWQDRLNWCGGGGVRDVTSLIRTPQHVCSFRCCLDHHRHGSPRTPRPSPLIAVETQDSFCYASCCGGKSIYDKRKTEPMSSFQQQTYLCTGVCWTIVRRPSPSPPPPLPESYLVTRFSCSSCGGARFQYTTNR